MPHGHDLDERSTAHSEALASPTGRIAPRAHTACWATLFLFLVGSASTPLARAQEAVSGQAVDLDTGQPIAGAWIFEAVARGSRAADVRHFASVRVARADDAGRFAFTPRPRSWFSLLRPEPEKRYHFYHPNYGLLWGRAAKAGRVQIRASLRESHLRQADAAQLCPNRNERDPLREKIHRLACPPADPLSYPDGTPRAVGPYDERARRIGHWTFFRSDGSVVAQGHYDAGAAIGEWSFYPPSPHD